jgi:hypothetical protein
MMIILRISRTLEENLEQYQWEYGPHKFLSVVYPPHALWDSLPGEERETLNQIFDLDILISLFSVELVGADIIYFRLPTQLEGQWTLRELAAANRRHYETLKSLKDIAYMGIDDLNPLFKNNIGTFL